MSNKSNATDEIVSQFFGAIRILKHKLDLTSPIFHLPIAQLETLRFIGEKKQVSMKEVADCLAITPPSVTVLINNLVTLGFIQRQSQKNDRRTIHLLLTKKGADAMDKSMEQRCKIFKKLLGKLNSREQLQLVNILEKMNVNK